MNPYDLDEPLTSPLAPPAGQSEISLLYTLWIDTKFSSDLNVSQIIDP